MCVKCNNKRKALGIPALSGEKCADSDSAPDLGYTKQSSAHCVNCCALYQGLRYLGHTSNTENPDEKTIYETLGAQRKELAGILLAVMEHGMFNSPLDGRVVSPDIDFVEWMIVVYSAVRGTKTEKDLCNWGFIRCLPAVAIQKFINGRGGSLSVIMGTNEYDVNFLVGNDLGNAVYCQWLKHTLSEAQWDRMCDDPQSVNEERAVDAVEVCLATLYFTALYPVEFRFWGDPFENYAGLEHSIRCIAVSTGCVSTTGSQRTPPGASLSSKVIEMGKVLAAVLGTPTVIITMEECYAVLKKVRDGPIEPTQIVKDEPEDEVTDVSADIGVVEANLVEEDDPTRDGTSPAATQTEAEQDAPDEARAPGAPISTKKRRIGAMLEELMTQADNIKVCPVCWISHPTHSCPRAVESEALYTTLSHMHSGGAPPPTNVPVVSSSTVPAGSEMAERGEDMEVDATEGDVNATQAHPGAT